MNSYNSINYKLRPQKQIERGLLAVLLNDFTGVINKKINYIGMGSLLFADFTFFNKNCQLNRMISIEHWEPDRNEKINIIASYFSNTFNATEIAKNLIDLYPEQSITFFMDFIVTKKIELLAELVNCSIHRMSHF